MERINFYNTGIQLKDNRTDVAGYLHGVQSISGSISVNIFNFPDSGRVSSVDHEGISSFSFEIERILANYSDNSSYIVGPFLHHIFAISDTKFPMETGPISYKNSFFLSNFGHAFTGNVSTDAKDFDVRIATKVLQYTDVSLPEFDYLFKKCIVKNINYSINAGEVLRETISFESQIRLEATDADFEKTIINLNEITPFSEKINAIRGYNFDKENSTLPDFLDDICSNSFFVDNFLVKGIQNIGMSLALDYFSPIDTGNIQGATNNENVNFFKFIKVPLDISINFGITAQKEIPEILLNDEKFGRSKIIIVFRCSNNDPNSNTPNYLVFHFGKKNRLQSISKSGGSTSGDPVSYDFEYKNTNNDFCCYFTNNTNFSIIEESTEKF